MLRPELGGYLLGGHFLVKPLKGKEKGGNNRNHFGRLSFLPHF